MKREQELAKNTLILTIGKICTQFITFVLLPLYTSLLSTSDYGLYDLISTYATLLFPIVNLTIDQGLFRHLINARDNNDEKKILISTAFFSNLIQLLFFIFLYIAFGRFITLNYKGFLVTIVCYYVISNLLLQTSRGLGDTFNYTLASMITATVTIITNIVFIAVMKIGIIGLFYGIIFGQIACIFFLAYRIKLKNYISIKYFKKDIFCKLVKYSLPLVPANLSWWVVGASDRTIVSSVLGVAVNGAYSVANKFSSLIAMFYNVFNMAWTESVALHFDDNDRNVFLSNTIDSMIVMFGGICTSLLAVMPILYPLIINQDYYQAYNQIPILTLAVFFQIVAGLYSVIYLSLKKTKETAKTAFFAAVINVVTDLLLINFIGLYAASISTLIAYFSMALYRYIDIKKYCVIKLNKLHLLQLFVMFSVVIVAYYLNNFLLTPIVILSDALYCYIANKSLILAAMGRTKKYGKK